MTRDRTAPLKYISICSGIEAATVAFHPLGWQPLAFAEIEAFPCALLAHHYPSVPNLGDMTRFREWPEDLLAECDLLVGGPPCVAFSVAGLRNSLSDARGNLTLAYAQLIDHIDTIRRKHGRPPIISIFENVPGIYSTKDNAFGCLVGAICGQDAPVETETGKWPTSGVFWGKKRRVGYRTLDAQYFGLAQRRRRCFLLAVPNELVEHLGDRACPSEILSIPESLRGDTPPSREKRKDVAPTLSARTKGGGGLGTDFDCDGGLIAASTSGDGYWREGLGPLRAREQDSHENLIGCWWDGGQVSQTLDAVLSKGQTMPEKNRFPAVLQPVTHAPLGEGFNSSEDGTGRGSPLVPTLFSIMPMNSGKDFKARIVDVAQPLMASQAGGNQGGDFILQPLAFQTRGSNIDANGTIAGTLGCNSDRASGGAPCVAFDTTQITSKANYSNPQPGDPCHPLVSTAHPTAIAFHPTQDPISSADGTTHAMGCGSKGGQASVAVAIRNSGRDCDPRPGRQGTTTQEELMFCLQASQQHAVAFSCKDSGADVGDIAPTLRAMGHSDSHANAGGQVAVAYRVHGENSTAMTGNGDARVADPVEVARCLDTCGGYSTNQGGNVVAHAVAIPIQEDWKRTGISTDDPQAGIGIGTDGEPMYTLQAGAQHAVAFDLRGREGGSQLEGPHDIANIRAASGGSSRSYLMVDRSEPLWQKGIEQGGPYACTHETYTGALLPRVRKEIGEEAFTEWGLGILDSLQPPEILRAALHGSQLRPAAFSRRWVVYCTLSRPEDRAEGALQSLWEAACERRTPQGSQPSQQLARELGAYLSELSQPGPRAEGFMRDLWGAAEGIGLLRQALSAIQEARRSAQTRVSSKDQVQSGRMREDEPCPRTVRQTCPASESRDTGDADKDEGGTNDESVGNPPLAVRRIVPEEAEFLMGFPRGYTAIPYRGKPAADGNRYKALGNSMAVPCMAWIARRIQMALEMAV